MFIKYTFIFIAVFLQFVVSFRIKRDAYDLPSGALEATGLSQIKRVFKCESNGYYADVANECKLFHICSTPASKESKDMKQSTKACPQNFRFDQSKLICVTDSDAIPCKASPDFFYLNNRIGGQNPAFLGPSEVDTAKNARPDYKAKIKLPNK